MNQTMNLYIKLLMLICITITTAKSQDFQDDYNKILEKFSNSNRIKMQATIKVFREKSDKRPEFVQECTMKRDGPKTFCTFDQMIMICNGKQTLFVNKEERIIAIQDMKNAKKNNSSIWDDKNMKALATTRGEHRLIETLGDLKTYEISSPNEPIEKTIIAINVKNQIIEQLTYFYNKQLYPHQQKVTIDYSEFDANAQFDKSTFSFDAYITSKGKTYHPASKYNNYQIQVINSLDVQ